MAIRLRLGERVLAVTLPAHDGEPAAVDGVRYRLEAPGSGPAALGVAGWHVREVALRIDDRPVDAVVARRADRVLVAVHGRVFAFALGDTPRGGASHAGSGLVVAPMPGKVTRVLVAAGDAIEAGQPVVVLEAMKMETTLAAEIDGRVDAVRVTPGAMVEGGAVLVEIAAG